MLRGEEHRSVRSQRLGERLSRLLPELWTAYDRLSAGQCVIITVVYRHTRTQDKSSFWIAFAGFIVSYDYNIYSDSVCQFYNFLCRIFVPIVIIFVPNIARQPSSSVGQNHY